MCKYIQTYTHLQTRMHLHTHSSSASSPAASLFAPKPPCPSCSRTSVSCSSLQDNHEWQMQERRRQQRLQELEQKRRSWAAGELGGFGRSSSENDVELLTKRGSDDLPPFLHPRPISPSYRPPNTRRSRLSLGTSADRELLTFLEGTTGSPEELKFNSLPRSSPPRPTMAWMEPAAVSTPDPRGAQEHQEEAPHPSAAWRSHLPAKTPGEATWTFPQARGGGGSVLKKRNSEPVGLGPVRSPPLSPLTVGVEEHELVTGLAQFDLQSPRSAEETAQMTPSHSNPKESPGLSATTDSLRPGDPGSEPSPALEEGAGSPEEPSCPALPSACSSDPENKDPGRLFYISDATDCSLTLDCSEGTDSRPAGVADRGGDEGQRDASVSSGVGEPAGSPVSIPTGASSTPGSRKSEPIAKGGLCRDRAAKGRGDVPATALKRNSLKEAPPGAPKTGSARRGPAAAATKPARPPSAGVRTLTASENENMRKVVPISRSSRGSGGWKRPSRDTLGTSEPAWARRSSVKGTSDTSPRRTSTGGTADEPRLPRASGSMSGRPGREPALQARGSVRKPSAKPLRNLPRQKPDENKICRSDSRDPENPEEEPKPPPPPPTPSAPRVPASVPSFARNTVASSSRCMRTDAAPVARAPGLMRTVSQRQLRVKGGPEDAPSKDSSTLRRASSARTPKKCSDSTVEGPGSTPEAALKGKGAGERGSLRLRDPQHRTTLGKILNPLRK